MFCGTLQLCVYSLSYEYNNTTFTKTPMARIGSTQEVSIDFTTSLDKLGWYKTHSTPKKIAEENNISVRSIYRYEKAFSERQFTGLKPANREKHLSQKLPAETGNSASQRSSR